MRIVIDMQGAQTESRLRGIGNYSYGLTKAIIKNNKSDEIIIVLNNLLKESIDEIYKEFKDLIDPKNIIIWKKHFCINCFWFSPRNKFINNIFDA